MLEAHSFGTVILCHLLWGPEAPSCGSEGVTGQSLGMDVAPSVCELAGVSMLKLLWFLVKF